MKSLLIKDFYVVKKQIRSMLLIVILFSVIPSLSYTPLAGIYTVSLPLTAMAYDERCKWDRLAAAMPYTARQLVLSKYILGWGFCAAGSLISLAVSLVCRSFDFRTVAPESLLISAAVGGLLLAVSLPLMFCFGVEKARVISIVVVVVAAVMVGAVISLVVHDAVGRMLHGSVGLLLLLLLVGSTLVSIRLSVYFYTRREF